MNKNLCLGVFVVKNFLENSNHKGTKTLMFY